MKIYDCSNSIQRPDNRGYGGSFENAIVAMLKKYGKNHNVEFVDNAGDCDLLFTNDVFPDRILHFSKPRVKRMDGIFWQENLKERNEKYNKAAQQADHVIFISEFSKDSLEALYGFLPARYSVETNWVDEELFYPLPAKIDTPKRFAAIATSWEREEKRFLDTMAFAEHVLDGQLFLIGTVPNVKLPSNVIPLGYIEYEAHDNPITDRLRRGKLGSILRQMDALVNLSYRDPAPKVVPEAICCGLPVLYADSGGTHEMTHGYGTAIPDPCELVFENNTPRLCMSAVRASYRTFVDHYTVYRENALKSKGKTKALVRAYCRVFDDELERAYDAKSRIDRKRFEEFLSKDHCSHLEDWEKTLLGGFGGYKSRSKI